MFHLAKPDVRRRLEESSGKSVTDAATLREAIGQRFQHFTAKNVKACAISLPPDSLPNCVSIVAAKSPGAQ